MIPISKETKKKILDNLITCGILSAKFSGKITITITDGGIAWIERIETMK